MAREDEKLTHETGRRVENIPVAHDGFSVRLWDHPRAAPVFYFPTVARVLRMGRNAVQDAIHSR